jgi:hypothetical protein
LASPECDLMVGLACEQLREIVSRDPGLVHTSWLPLTRFLLYICLCAFHVNLGEAGCILLKMQAACSRYEGRRGSVQVLACGIVSKGVDKRRGGCGLQTLEGSLTIHSAFYLWEKRERRFLACGILDNALRDTCRVTAQTLPRCRR